MQDPHDSFDNARDPQAPVGTVRFTLDNGAVDEYRLDETVDLATTLQIAHRFFDGRTWSLTSPGNIGDRSPARPSVRPTAASRG